MATILRWGLLGTARINTAVIGPIKASPRNELLAVASRETDRAEAYAKEWGIPRAYGSYAALLADHNVDVVYIPLPNHLHAPWAIRAAAAGKHVLCEKPLAMSLQEVDGIASSARAAGVVVAEAFMYRHHPRTLKVKELVEAGAIGELHVLRGAFTFQLDRPGDIRLDPSMGGGSLWDVGCYPINFARFVVGVEPVEVFGSQVVGPSEVDLTFAGQLRFPGNVIAQFDSGFRSQLRMHMELVGSDGTINIPQTFLPDSTSTLTITVGKSADILTIKAVDPYRGEVEDMFDAVVQGKPPRISLGDSRANIATLVALSQSARGGRPVALE